MFQCLLEKSPMAENREIAEMREDVKKLQAAQDSAADDAAAMRRIQSVARWIIAASLVVNLVVLVNVLQLSGGAEPPSPSPFPHKDGRGA